MPIRISVHGLIKFKKAFLSNTFQWNVWNVSQTFQSKGNIEFLPAETWESPFERCGQPDANQMLFRILPVTRLQLEFQLENLESSVTIRTSNLDPKLVRRLCSRKIYSFTVYDHSDPEVQTPMFRILDSEVHSFSRQSHPSMISNSN